MSTYSNSKVESVKDAWAPLKCFHPTQAIVQDKETGDTFEWNSRAHRKLRDPQHTDRTKRQEQRRFPKLWCYEPHIVTWWLNVTNMIANTFWTIGGAFSTWPSSNVDASAKVVYASGIIAGVFMIASCYFTYVEAINQSHGDIVIPKSDHHHVRKFLHPGRLYGRPKSPIGYKNHGIDAEKVRHYLQKMGFPYLEDYDTGELITRDSVKKYATEKMNEISSSVEQDGGDVEQATASMKQQDDNRDDDGDDQTNPLVGTKVNIREGRYVATTAILDVTKVDHDSNRSYEWWTWSPALDYVGVFTSLIGFVSSIVYLIPMCVGYPLSKNGNASMGVTLFFVDILQVIPYMCFAAVCHILIAEAAGSWWKPKFDSIGYYTAVFNWIGAWGFLLCGALAIPGTVSSTCCPNMARWGSSFACFWGSASYFVGGCLMWIEFANPQPMTLQAKKAQTDDGVKKGQTADDDSH